MKIKLLMTMMVCAFALSASEKIYIDDDQLEHKHNAECPSRFK